MKKPIFVLLFILLSCKPMPKDKPCFYFYEKSKGGQKCKMYNIVSSKKIENKQNYNLVQNQTNPEDLPQNNFLSQEIYYNQ